MVSQHLLDLRFALELFFKTSQGVFIKGFVTGASMVLFWKVLVFLLVVVF